MKVLKFKCELLSDVILNQKFATEGPNQTLDFIPGNNFLGIVAGALYGKKDTTWTIFHSGKVRFGDAHPANGDNRTLRVPASFYIPKLQQKLNDEEKEYYIHHLIPELQSDELLKKQLKQCRTGFYDFMQEKAVQVKVNTDFSIKSAYDKEKRRSADEKMFGYQCISKGLTYYFSIEIEDDALETEIVDALCGMKRIGRSRSAQYGLVEIRQKDFNEPVSIKKKNDELIIYADGRLIFLDEYGMPTCQPTINQLLGKDVEGTILWEKSQIRTFRYSPYNYKRKCFDTDRFGMEKGSVIVVSLKECDSLPNYIGAYRNEGFGKVIYNPSFLFGEEIGMAKYKPCSPQNLSQTANRENDVAVLVGTPLLDYIAKRKTENQIILDSYKKVNDWVNGNSGLFKGERFASQWGQIRNIAMKNASKEDIKIKLFGDNEINVDGYLTHGIAEDKWNEERRINRLKMFIDSLTSEEAQIVIVNLASEMAKKCTEGGKK